MTTPTAVSALALAVLAASGLAAQGQSPAERDLANARSISCVFRMSAKAVWNKDNMPTPTVRRSGMLTVNISEINVGAGSAVVVTTSGNHDVTVQGDGKNLYFLEASRGGRIGVTMVLGDYSTGTRLKAAYSAHDYLPIDLPSFKSEPEIIQYYGDCEAKS